MKRTRLIFLMMLGLVATNAFSQSTLLNGVRISYDNRIEAKEILAFDQGVIFVSEVDQDKEFRMPLRKNVVEVVFVDAEGITKSVSLNNYNGSSSFGDAVVSDSLVYILYSTNIGSDVFSEIVVLRGDGMIKSQLRLHEQISGGLSVDQFGNVLFVAYAKDPKSPRLMTVTYVITPSGRMEQRIISSSIAFNGLTLISSKDKKWCFHGQIFTDSVNVTNAKPFYEFKSRSKYENVLVTYDVDKSVLDQIELISSNGRLVFLAGDTSGAYFEKYIDDDVFIVLFRDHQFFDLLKLDKEAAVTCRVKTGLHSTFLIINKSESINEVYQVSTEPQPHATLLLSNLYSGRSIIVDDFLDMSSSLRFVLKHEIDYQQKKSVVSVDAI